MWEYNHNEELYHYGVLGMKWGVRRGRADKAYDKAKKKLKKLDVKTTKRAEKLDKLTEKHDRVTSSLFVINRQAKEAKLNRKITRATRKYKNAVMKGSSWYKAMEKTFANTSVKFDQEVINIGKEYAEIRNARRVARLG